MLDIRKLAGIIATQTQSIVPSFPSASTNKYRFQQPLLFQRGLVKSVPFVYTNHLNKQVTVRSDRFYFDGSSYGSYVYGPTGSLICPCSSWPWKNPVTGDYVDANGTQQGAVPFATSSVLVGGSPAGVLQIDITSAITYINAKPQWCALLLKTTGNADMAMVGTLNTLGDIQSTVTITFLDNSTETLIAWVTASLRASTSYTDAMDDYMGINTGVIEFHRPTNQTRPILSAKLNLSHTTVHSSQSGGLQVQVFVVSPILPSLTPVPGIAAAYTLDQGIAVNPNVIVTQQYTSDKLLTDVLDQYRSGNTSLGFIPGNGYAYANHAEFGFDPTLWGTPGVGHLSAVAMPTPAQLNNLLPRREFGKFVGYTYPDRIRVVNGSDALAASRGFVPLAPGRTALEILHLSSNIKHGQCWFDSAYNGGSDLDLWFDRSRIGQVSEVFVRYYVMLGSGWDANTDDFGLYFNAPFTAVGKYPEESALDPQALGYRQADRSGKFFGGAQQQAGGVFQGYKYKTRQRPDGTPDDTRELKWGGGGYGVTSGIFGYQGRYQFKQGVFWDTLPGPAVGGAVIGMELYDFGSNDGSIPSQTGISNWDGLQAASGQNGGIGFLKPFKWYCLEMRWKLNTIVPYVLPPRGKDFREGGFLVDGVLEFFVDGIKASTTPLFATRSSLMLDWALQVSSGYPFDTEPGSPTYLRPITNVTDTANYMGFASFIGAPYYGGRSPCKRDLCTYFDGIVVSTSYVGPMGGLSRENGGLGVAAVVAPPVIVPPQTGPAWANSLVNNVWSLLPNTALMDWINTPAGVPDLGYVGNWWQTAIVNEYSSPAFDESGHIAYCLGGGHSAGSFNGIVAFNQTSLTWSEAVYATPPSKYPPTINTTATMLGPIVYPSGAYDGNVVKYFVYLDATTLTNPLDSRYIAPYRAPMPFHAYGALTYWVNPSGVPMVSSDYVAVSDANINTKNWAYASSDVLAIQLNALGLGFKQMQQGTKAHHDTTTGHRFTTCTAGDDGLSVRHHILEIDPVTHTILGAYPTNAAINSNSSLCAKDRKLWVFQNQNTAGTYTSMACFTFDMDTHAIAYYSIVGDTISFINDGSYSQESVPCADGNGSIIYRWNYGPDPNAMFELNTVPISGAGTFSSPYVINQTKRALSGMSGRISYQYKLHYSKTWNLFMVQTSPHVGWHALRLS